MPTPLSITLLVQRNAFPSVYLSPIGRALHAFAGLFLRLFLCCVCLLLPAASRFNVPGPATFPMAPTPQRSQHIPISTRTRTQSMILTSRLVILPATPKVGHPWNEERIRHEDVSDASLHQPDPVTPTTPAPSYNSPMVSFTQYLCSPRVQEI
jgi:hypothetical protein